MSPFSIYIRKLREKRNLRQSDAAILLGYEQSYLCGLEMGSKPTPKSEFLILLIKRYELNEEEITALEDAVNRSKRRFLLSQKASLEEYDLLYQWNNQTGNLSHEQIILMKAALNRCI